MATKKNSASSILAEQSAPPSAAPEKTSPLVEDKQVTITSSALQELLASVISKTQEQASLQTKALVDAILESRKPYVDPKRAENEKRWRESMRRQRLKLDASLKADQNRCEHIMGSNALSEYPDLHRRSSILKHALDTGEVIGMCTNCGRVWWPDDPDYFSQLKRHTTNKMSQAGQRFSVIAKRQLQKLQEKEREKEAQKK